MVKTYIGTKQIEAESMEKDGQEGYKVVYPDGYESWSPQGVFEDAYCGNGAMNFGHALLCLQAGKKVSRSGWNGKDMYLILVPGTPSAQLRDGTPYKDATGLDELEILPHIDMWTVNSSGRRAMLPGWLASQTDMLSSDWGVVS